MNELLIAALMASVHPNRLWHRRGGYAVPACCLPCDAMSELLLVSDYSGCTDQNRPSVNAAGVCSYLRDRMSPSVATCATACRSRSVTTRYARAAGSLGAQDRQTDERRRGSIQGEADVGLLKATSGAPAAC